MATLKFVNINKIYDNSFQAVFDFNLEIKDKEFIVFVGPSGCGKSTTLRMVAGLEDITSGELYIDDELMNNVLPKDRNIAMVFQNYALYPHMTVYDNMAFGLKLRKVPKDEIEKKVNEAAKILGLTQYLRRKPKALSGGQRQRVALGRAIVRNPKVFLMDEPLSNLDAKLRVQMRSEIAKIHKKVNATTIYVTHDQTEAMTMADRIVIMKDGYVQQVGTPKELYATPSNMFVAGFIGSPAMNFFEVEYDGESLLLGDKKIKIDALTKKLHDNFYNEQLAKAEDLVKAKQAMVDDRIEEIKDHYASEIAKGKTVESIVEKDEFSRDYQADLLKAQENLVRAQKALEESKQPHKVTLGVRPEDVYLKGDSNNPKESNCSFDIDVDVSELLGHEIIVYGDILPEHQIVMKTPATADVKVGDRVSLSFNMESLHIFDTETTLRIK